MNDVFDHEFLKLVSDAMGAGDKIIWKGFEVSCHPRAFFLYDDSHSVAEYEIFFFGTKTNGKQILTYRGKSRIETEWSQHLLDLMNAYIKIEKL